MVVFAAVDLLDGLNVKVEIQVSNSPFTFEAEAELLTQNVAVVARAEVVLTVPVKVSLVEDMDCASPVVTTGLS